MWYKLVRENLVNKLQWHQICNQCLAHLTIYDLVEIPLLYSLHKIETSNWICSWSGSFFFNCIVLLLNVVAMSPVPFLIFMRKKSKCMFWNIKFLYCLQFNWLKILNMICYMQRYTGVINKYLTHNMFIYFIPNKIWSL